MILERLVKPTFFDHKSFKMTANICQSEHSNAMLSNKFTRIAFQNGCFGFNGTLRQFFLVYIELSAIDRDTEKGTKDRREKKSKQLHSAPFANTLS